MWPLEDNIQRKAEIININAPPGKWGDRNTIPKRFSYVWQHYMPIMTTTTRLPKSGNEWTEIDLATYEIKIEYQDIQQFFGEKPLPTPSVPEDILTALTLDDVVVL